MNAFENPTPSHPYDKFTNDECLLKWQELKNKVEEAKADEMEIRKYIVKREFPNPNEGMNNKDLGEGYTLKAGVKYNYKLADNDIVEKGLNQIASFGNEGSFIADRLVSWTPSFLLKEYRQLQDDKAKGSKFAADCLDVVNGFLTISEASPTLEIKGPKEKK
jgi:hypothetical protein